MKKIYITSTLKNDWNRNFNKRICELLENYGFDCYLPQRDTDQTSDRLTRYSQNIEAIRECETLLAIGENESINWGLEVGYAYGIGKKIVILCEERHESPVMSLGMTTNVFKVEGLDKIEGYFDQLITKLPKENQ